MIFIPGCIEPYDPPLDNADIDLLVVDGFVNVTEGVATVRLSRTLAVKSADPFPMERSAFVQIEDSNGLLHRLNEIAPGSYVADIVNAGPGVSYRVLINTVDGHAYVSDFVVARHTPPIDSITYSVTRDGIEFAVNTHDPTGSSRHFRWKYTETYEYHANYYSSYKFAAQSVVVPRPIEEQFKICWKTNLSTDILIASTSHLSEAVVSRFPISLVPYGSIKLTEKYSLLVQQQALTEEAYQYWLNLEKSTEHLGGLFDPLPAEVKGNLYSTSHPNETVIGYFSGSGVAEARTYLRRNELPAEVVTLFRNPYCQIDTILLADLEFTAPTTLLIDAIFPPGPGGPIGYTTSESLCIDCTLRGGTVEKPSFWE